MPFMAIRTFLKPQPLPHGNNYPQGLYGMEAMTPLEEEQE